MLVTARRWPARMAGMYYRINQSSVRPTLHRILIDVSGKSAEPKMAFNFAHLRCPPPAAALRATQGACGALQRAARAFFCCGAARKNCPFLTYRSEYMFALALLAASTLRSQRRAAGMLQTSGEKAYIL